MIYKRIIPCLDVDKGRVTRGVQYQNVKDIGDPLSYARKYDADGADDSDGPSGSMRRSYCRIPIRWNFRSPIGCIQKTKTGP